MEKRRRSGVMAMCHVSVSVSVGDKLAQPPTDTIQV